MVNNNAYEIFGTLKEDLEVNIACCPCLFSRVILESLEQMAREV